MSRNRSRMTVAILAISTALLVRAEPQDWTSVNGRTIRGEFVRMIGQTVSIRTSDGSTVSIALARLDEASRARAQALGRGEAVAASDDMGTAAGGTPQTGGVPSDEEIAKFKTSFQQPGRSERVVFQAFFGVPNLSPQDRRKVARGGKVPYRITMDLMEVKTINGRNFSKRLEGRGNIVVLDEAGMVVDRAKEALGKLCPS
ncbi:MAG: hypothetical protein PHR35_12265 [Kiritimatiellae bacterium]|nr:hypothetical protein [Kiritimatiellia bacterium]